MLTVTVNLGDRSYPIHIGEGLLGSPELVNPFLGRGRHLVVTNTTVAPLYLETVQKLFKNCEYIVLEDGEQYKTLDSVSRIYEVLLKGKYDRNTTIVALGGGVIGDMAGFAAATYLRGVRFFQIPTTLLSQVDSSVGGKTGVNYPLGKNMIGAFFQPECVLIDTAVLRSLPARELKAGLAEVIKYALIGDADFLSWLEQERHRLLDNDVTCLSEAIRISCEHKAAIVARDEREGGVRALLNLGHTFGHAIETASGYGTWLHGEAVAAGMVMAADLSMRSGLLGQKDALRIKQIIKNFGLPVAPPADITIQQYQDIMLSDKKARAGIIRFVLLEAIGRAIITSDIKSSEVTKTLSAGSRLCE